jgi:starvation-inducible DNA-binding protein
MTTTAASRRLHDVARRRTAAPQLAARLQAILADLIELSLQSKQAHWNVVGQNFRGLHLQLDELVNHAREGSDTGAERMRALGLTPDGSSATVTATTTLPAYPQGEQHTTAVVRLVLNSLTAAVETLREVHDVVDTADPSTSDLLHAPIIDLEKQAWMLAAQHEVS